MAEGSIAADFVCGVCLSATSLQRGLIEVGCFKPGDIEHAKAPRVPVRWNHEARRIERIRSFDFSTNSFFRSLSIPINPDTNRVDIRPMPRMNVPQGGRRFIMCDFGWRCGGDACTFAHSIEERDAWNEELLRQQQSVTAVSDRRLSYDERIGVPLFSHTGRQDTTVTQPSYTTPSSYTSSESVFYEGTRYHPSRPPMSVAPSPLYDMAAVSHSHQQQQYPVSHLDHHGATANTSAWTTSGSYHHPLPGGGHTHQHYHHQHQQQLYDHQQRQQLYDHQQQQQEVYDHSHQHYHQPRPSVLAQPQETDGSQTWHSHTHSHIHQPIGSRRQRYQTHSGIPESQVSSEFLSSPLANLLPGLGQHSNVSRVQSAPTSANQHAVSIPEDPWPSLGSPTTTPRGFPLGSQFTPHSPAGAAHDPSPNPPPQREPLRAPHQQLPVSTTSVMSQPAQQQHQAPPSPHLPSSKPISHGELEKQQLSEPSMVGPVIQKSTGQFKPGGVIYQSLIASNYKNKFQELLKCEESTHKSILENRCNGEHQLVLHQSGLKRPHWMTRESDFRHVRYGYIALNGDQIAYAVQAAQDKEGVTLTYNGNTICTADILSENYSHVEEKLYIGFDRDAVTKLNHSECPVKPGPSDFNIHVSFKLKHSYFNNLKRSLDRLRPDIIQRLTPNYQSFESHQPNLHMGAHPMYRPYEKLCSPDQLKALKTIALCPSSGPPVLIAGPFGTGKTRVLAVAVQFLFERPTSFVRVLVCTQQRVSADNFLETFLNLQQARNVGFADAFLVREYGFHNPKLKRYYRSVSNLEHHISRYSEPNRLLLVTTCLTAPHLANFLRRDFFTHIFIDEGAQMREPEAVAPLCLANSNTMIVIAGDHHQVGPAMLVLGSKARDNGLDKSLLERLLLHYRYMEDVTANHHVTLVTNYRCHPDILELSGNLFYETPLKPPQDKAPPKLHPDYPTSFLFVCSSYSEKMEETNRNTNEEEAVIILEKLKELSERWPYKEWGDRDLFNACIMSPSRSQLTVISKLIDDRRRGYFRLKSVRRLPTYDMQGREFRFLLLSTSEPTTDDGYIKNPTKSFCDRFVFNTAITRAQSLIVSVGNPFLLLEVEKLMIMRYGEKGKCWSTYLDYCLRNKTITFDDSLELSRTKQKKILSKVREIIKERLSRDFAQEPMTPADKNVFSSADEFPPLPQAAARAPPLATPTKATPISTPTRAAQTPPSTPPVTRPPPHAQQARPQPFVGQPPKQPPQQSTPRSPTVQWPVQRSNPQAVQLRPQRVLGGQQVKQILGSAQQQLPQRQSPNSPKSAQPIARPETQQSRPMHVSVHPRTPGQNSQQPHSPVAQQPRSPIAQQPRSPAAQQPWSPVAQQPRSPVAQLPRSPVAQQKQQQRPPGAPQSRPTESRQTQLQLTQPHPQAAVATYSRASRQPEASMLVGARKPVVKPSKLSLASHSSWGNQQAGLAPGAIESPAEFPPLGAVPTRKRQQQQQPGAQQQQPGTWQQQPGAQQQQPGSWQQQQPGAQGKRKERKQVPSNSIRDLSARQTKRKEEMSTGEDEPAPPTSANEVISGTDSEPESKEEATTKSAQTVHRFEEEFTVRKVLGQGGFGVVFHVKSKFDHGDYALKLTKLPADKTEQSKVMREVRALAKLENHQHVVRYNTSWKERAPADWKTRSYWSELKESSTISMSSRSPVPVQHPGPAGDSSSHTSPSSAEYYTPSDSTIQSVGAVNAETSNKDSSSFTVEFKDSQSGMCSADLARGLTMTLMIQTELFENNWKDEARYQEEQTRQVRPHVPPTKVGGDLLTQLLDPPMVLMIQTELCEKKTLKNWLSDHIHDRKRRTVVNFFEQILDALCFIHQPRELIRFVHRDLKPSNIFFARGREESLKIGDFGLVKGNAVIEPTAQTSLLDVSARQHQSPSSIAGTLLYMSPEQREGRGCDHKADIYALGVIFFELNYPFTTDSERFKVLSQLREGKLPKGFRDKLPNEVTLIIQLLMDRNPIKRPSAEEIKTDKHNELKRLRKKAGKKSKPALIPVLKS